jgi:hypothetical protein
MADLGPVLGTVGRTRGAQHRRSGTRNAGRIVDRPAPALEFNFQKFEAAAYWPWLARTCWQAWLIFGRLACRQPSIPRVSLGLTCSWAWQNLVTSGWQAARSRSLPWLAAGGGCGGNCWAAAAATAKTKAIDNIDIRIMVPLVPHLRASGPSPLGKSYLIFCPHCRAARPLLSGCAQTFAAVCDRAATTMWQRACASARCGDTSRREGRLAQLVERLLYTQKVGGSRPSPPTTLRRSLSKAKAKTDWSCILCGTFT